MSVSITIDLSDQDLEHFHDAMKAAKSTAAAKSEQEVVEAAGKLLLEAQKAKVPDFISERLVKLDALIAMVRDEGWALGEEDRKRVLSALVYFADPTDVIPDHVPVLGFLDDAIMIELCVRELRHEIEAYDDFCDYRQNEAVRRGEEPAKVARAEWLVGRREELQDRMHRRRERDYGTGYGRSSGWGSGKNYSGGWRPGMMQVR